MFSNLYGRGLDEQPYDDGEKLDVHETCKKKHEIESASWNTEKCSKSAQKGMIGSEEKKFLFCRKCFSREKSGS